MAQVEATSVSLFCVILFSCRWRCENVCLIVVSFRQNIAIKIQIGFSVVVIVDTSLCVSVLGAFPICSIVIYVCQSQFSCVFVGLNVVIFGWLVCACNEHMMLGQVGSQRHTKTMPVPLILNILKML